MHRADSGLTLFVALIIGAAHKTVRKHEMDNAVCSGGHNLNARVGVVEVETSVQGTPIPSVLLCYTACHLQLSQLQIPLMVAQLRRLQA